MIVTPKALAELSKIDIELADLLSAYGPPPAWSRPPGLVSLVKMILEQQVSLDSARATYYRLQTYVGSVDTVTLLKLNAEEWRQCAVSRQKARYITLLCQKIEEDSFDLDHVITMDDDRARNYLTQLVGVGPWTANVYLLFCLQRPDIWPTGDIALINMIKEMYGIPKVDVDVFALRWHPYRSLAAYCLWHRYLADRNRMVYYD